MYQKIKIVAIVAEIIVGVSAIIAIIYSVISYKLSVQQYQETVIQNEQNSRPYLTFDYVEKGGRKIEFLQKIDQEKNSEGVSLRYSFLLKNIGKSPAVFSIDSADFSPLDLSTIEYKNTGIKNGVIVPGQAYEVSGILPGVKKVVSGLPDNLPNFSFYISYDRLGNESMDKKRAYFIEIGSDVANSDQPESKAVKILWKIRSAN